MGTMKEFSRKEFVANNDSEDVKIGCLQRIADSTELMSQNYLKLLEHYRFIEKSRNQFINDLEHANNKIKALKGVITKLKKQLKNERV